MVTSERGSYVKQGVYAGYPDALLEIDARLDAPKHLIRCTEDASQPAALAIGELARREPHHHRPVAQRARSANQLIDGP
ncbi:hypothetical protein L6Q96_12185 [Candidatus Binatia bacterium]|nr:hypothetical protein [Candidatus Binatia bacterium]